MASRPMETPIPDEAFEAQAEFARAMGHPVRVKILHYLHEAGASMASMDLLALLGVSKGCLSQHLARMAAVGLVHTTRRGRRLYVEVTHPEVAEACELVRRVLQREARVHAESLAEE